MATPVALVNLPLLVTMGLTRALEASGYQLEPVDEPHVWARLHSRAAMLLGVRDDGDVELLRDLTSGSPSLAVVALLDPESGEVSEICVEAGARGCVSAEWSGQELILALEVGMRGMTILPATLARRLASVERQRVFARTLTTSQRSWLCQLASGTTVHDLASQVGFSERETYRRLRQIYVAMGVRSRTEALILASASGLLDDPASPERSSRS